MRTRGASWADVTRELGRSFGLRPRTAARHARGWTLAETAERLSQVLGRTGMDRTGRASVANSRISDWESWPIGGRRPTPAMLAALAELFEVPVSDLLDAADMEAMPAADRLVLQSASRPASAAVAGVPRADSDGDAGRAQARASLALAYAASATTIDEAGIEDLRGDLTRAAVAYLLVPLDSMATQLFRIRDEAGVLLERRQPPRYATELCVIAARSIGLIANVAMDRGQHDAAADHARAAWMLARSAGHDGVGQWVSALRASIAYWAGDPVGAAGYARSALERHGTGSGSTELFAAASLCRALGCLGDGEGVAQAARAVETARERTGCDEIAGVFAFPDAKADLYLASAFNSLGNRPRLALEHAHRAVVQYDVGTDARGYGDAAGARLDVALAYLGLGELDALPQVLEPVLELPQPLRVASVAQRLGRLARQLEGRYPTARLAAEMVDQITTWHSPATPKALPAGNGDE